jgi:putative polyketide hydroxylase
LFGRSFVLLTGIDGEPWFDAARAVSSRFDGLPFDAYRVGGPELRDPDNRFCEAYGLSPASACLVRPDGFIGWRAKAAETDLVASLSHALRTLLFLQ